MGSAGIAGTLVIIGGLAIALILFTGPLMSFFTSVTLPASHRDIINAMKITDTQANVVLTSMLVESSRVESGKGLSVTFIKGKTYSESVWLWKRNGDTELVMNIWGPDESGHTYGVEIARLSWDPFEVKFNDIVQVTMTPVTSMAPAIGYYQL